MLITTTRFCFHFCCTGVALVCYECTRIPIAITIFFCFVLFGKEGRKIYRQFFFSDNINTIWLKPETDSGSPFDCVSVERRNRNRTTSKSSREWVRVAWGNTLTCEYFIYLIHQYRNHHQKSSSSKGIERQEGCLQTFHTSRMAIDSCLGFSFCHHHFFFSPNLSKMLFHFTPIRICRLWIPIDFVCQCFVFVKKRPSIKSSVNTIIIIIIVII